MIQKSLIATTLAAGVISAAVGLAAPASAESKSNSSVGCSPCDRVSSPVTDGVTGAAKDAITGAVKDAITDAVSSPGDSTVEKWANFPGDTAKKWANFPGDTAKKWADFPGKQLKKWTGLG